MSRVRKKKLSPLEKNLLEWLEIATCIMENNGHLRSSRKWEIAEFKNVILKYKALK